jgi:hypothetical protein
MRFATKARLAMRNIMLLGVGLVIAYWVDQYYYSDVHSASLADVLHHIAGRFK